MEFASVESNVPFQTDMAGATNMMSSGQVSLSGVVYQDGVLGLKCFRGTDVSRVVGIEVVNTGGSHFLRSNPSKLTLKAHQYPAAFTTVVFERFAELNEPSFSDDIYRRDTIQLAQLPPEIKLVDIYPKKYEEYISTKVVPIVYVVGDKDCV